MGHTNSTTNYSLPQFITTDKPAWLTDINGAFSAIDSGLHTAQTDATTAKNTADNAQSDATAAGTAASTAGSKADGAIASLADTFDTTATYSVDDLVMYNSLLYKCTVAVTTPGAWTGTTNWSRTTVEAEIPADATELPFNTLQSTKQAIESMGIAPVAMTLVDPSSYFSSNNSRVYKLSDKLLFVTFDFVLSTVGGGWDYLFAVDFNTAFNFVPYGTVCPAGNDYGAYTQAYYENSKIKFRVQGAKASNTYRGQMIIPITN